MSVSTTDLDALKTWIGNLPNVSAGPHRFGGVEYKVNSLEFMHFHGQTHLDIRLSKYDQARVLSERTVEEHLFAPQGGWVTFRVKSKKDIEVVKEIIRLAYENAATIMHEHETRTRRSK